MEEQNNELMEVVTEETGVESSGLGTKAAVALGSVATLAVIAGVKAVKKFIAKRKAKKDEEQESDEVIVEDPEDEETED